MAGDRNLPEGWTTIGTDEDFHAAIAPFRVALDVLVAEATAVREAYGHLPDAASLGMAERAEEHRFSGEWGQFPVVDAHALGWMQLAVAEDIIKTICREFRSPGPSPVFGHVVLARSVVESCGRAAWLADPTIGVRSRIARAQSERLFSIAEAMKLPGTVKHNDARRRILSEANRQGFTKISRRDQSVVSLEERRPGQSQLVRWLYSENGDTGEVLYRWWSAIAHSTLFGVTLHMEPLQDTGDVGGLAKAAVTISSSQVQNVLSGVILGYAHVLEFHERLFGWSTDLLSAAIGNGLELVRRAR